MDFLVESIVAATADIFQSMLMMAVTALPPGEARELAWGDTVAAAIELEGLYRGRIEVLAPGPVALEITGTFLGLPAEQLDEDVKDAIGELANMVAGSLKLALSDQGKEIRLSIPTTRVLESYTFCPEEESRGSAVHFSMDSGDFLVALKLTASA